MDLDMIIYGDITLRQLLYVGGGVVAAIICLRIIKKIFFKKRPVLQHTVYFVCNNCDWEGQVSKFGTHCPKCNTPMN